MSKTTVKHGGGWLIALVLLSCVPLDARANSLADAVRNGDGAQVRALLKRRIDVNLPEADGTTALHWAVYRDDLDVTDLLLRAGADVKVRNALGVAPLSLACVNGNAAMIDRLLKAGADPNTASGAGETALMTAARTGNVPSVEALLARGADVHAREKERGQTALMWAAAQGHAGAVQALVRAGARVNERSTGVAPRRGPVAPAPVPEKVEPGNKENTAILSSEETPYYNLRAFLRAGGGGGHAGRRNTGPGAPPGLTPLAFASRAGHVEVVKALVAAGANVNDTVLDGSTALMLAVLNAHYDVAAALLEGGADPNASGPGWTPLHQLVWTRRPNLGRGPFPLPTGNVSAVALAKLLVAKGANPNARQTDEPADDNRIVLNRLGATPFLLAAQTADIEMMRTLLALGADPKITTDEGVTPLMAAAGVGIWKIGESPGTNEEALEAVKLALELGGDVNAADVNRDTAMHGAALRESAGLIRFLLSKGARLDVRNVIGWTPLTIAEGVRYPNSFTRSPETAAVLRELGAKDPGKRRAQDMTPTAVAGGQAQ